MDYTPLRSYEPLLARLEGEAAARGWPDVAVLPAFWMLGVNNAIMFSSAGARFWTEGFLPAAAAAAVKLPFKDRVGERLLSTWPTLARTGPIMLHRLSASRAEELHVAVMEGRGVLHGDPAQGGWGAHYGDASWYKMEAVSARLTDVGATLALGLALGFMLGGRGRRGRGAVLGVAATFALVALGVNPHTMSLLLALVAGGAAARATLACDACAKKRCNA
jgi:hypothetical protein